MTEEKYVSVKKKVKSKSKSKNRSSSVKSIKSKSSKSESSSGLSSGSSSRSSSRSSRKSKSSKSRSSSGLKSKSKSSSGLKSKSKSSSGLKSKSKLLKKSGSSKSGSVKKKIGQMNRVVINGGKPKLIIKTSSITDKGGRSYNEDRMSKKFVGNKLIYLGVYDGHGGAFVSNYLKNVFDQIVIKRSFKIPIKVPTIRSIYNQIQSNLETNFPQKAHEQGSTCLSIFITGTKMIIANVGDCRAVLCKDGLGIPLTKDHKPYWNDEQARINDLGGKIKKERGDDWRIGALSVSRAFGDLDCKKYITHKPDIFTHVITNKDNFIILACDGLWDVLDNQEAVHIVLQNPTGSAKHLMKKAKRKGSKDNITVIVAFFIH
jgi:serine/threonine protein phosphatase PrpC